MAGSRLARDIGIRPQVPGRVEVARSAHKDEIVGQVGGPEGVERPGQDRGCEPSEHRGVSNRV